MEIVGGLILGRDNRLLLARRQPKNNDLFAGGRWEFPGGKIEEGETHSQALIRELNEELAIIATDIEFLGTTTSPDGGLNLHLYSCYYQGEVLPKEHRALAWTTTDNLGNFDLCPTDAKFVSEQLPALASGLFRGGD